MIIAFTFTFICLDAWNGLWQVFGRFILKLETSLLVKALRFRLPEILFYSCPGVVAETINWSNRSDSLPSRIPTFEINAERLSPWTFRAEGIEQSLIHAESVDEDTLLVKHNREGASKILTQE